MPSAGKLLTVSIFKYKERKNTKKKKKENSINIREFLEELREYFSKYGDIESINVKTDPNTGRSRGFAFIVFAKAESLDKVKMNFFFIIKIQSS